MKAGADVHGHRGVMEDRFTGFCKRASRRGKTKTYLCEAHNREIQKQQTAN